MKRLIFFLTCLCICMVSSAQEINVSGKVTTSDTGEELIGVTIRGTVKSHVAITDFDGNFQMTARAGEKLTFTYLGYRNKTVSAKANMNVVLEPDNSNLNEVVVVGYGQVKRITNTGAVSAVNGKELRKVPVSSVQNTLSGKLPGFFSQQRSGQPGKDASDFFIRGVSSLNSDGNKPLIIVDDIEYSYDQLSQINVNEIESISILKDASTTAIYGIKGANGVLVVKTRRGAKGKPKINVRFETGLQTPVRKPKFLGSFETASLVNEAYANDGLQPQFSEEDLEHFRLGDDPYGHPDVNWYDEIYKSTAQQSNANIDISGGSDRLKYFISVGYFSQNSLMRNFDSGDDLKSDYRYRRFNFRSNLDFQVTKNLSMRLDITSRFMNINEPRGINTTGEIYNFSEMHPYSAPVMNPNGTYAYLYDTNSRKATLNARLANEGYNRTRRNDNNLLYNANWKMDFITPGLSTNFRIAYSSIDENARSAWRSDYPTYHYNSETDSYNINPNNIYTNGVPAITVDPHSGIKDVNIMASINYARVFNEVHDVSAMLLYNREENTVEYNSNTWTFEPQVPTKFLGTTLKLSYKYDSKYLIDFNMAYNGSDRFKAGNRYGFFPAVGLGWAISEEPWFKNKLKFVDLMKIRTSYGLVGSDVAMGNRYLYNQVYEKGDAYHFGDYEQESFQGYREGALGNDNVTWEKAKKFDIGLDLNLFNRISLTLDYFYDKRYDQLVYRNDIPLILGIGTSPVNVARTSNQGFDGQLGYRDKWGDFEFNTNFVFSYAKNKIIYQAEAQQLYPWLAATGHPIGQMFGYKWIGYYTPEDIALIEAADPKAPAVPNTDIPVQAGDLKYKDLNNDGIINDYDKSAIGKPNLPNTTLGWTVGGSWKGFTLSVLFQGSFNYSFSIVGTGIEPFKSQFQPLHQKRWTLERYQNGDPIEFPRLTSNPNTINSAEGYLSDFWLLDAWYIRLKTIDLSYEFPNKWIPKFMTGLRLYMNAYNLFTWTSYDKYQQDPEIQTNSAGDAYMNQRVINFGVNVSF
ncbi:MAG: SusC/RagA family TonB-linked outer membrane protein [Prevotella sp.]|jgi:TonB-linked SusC/RagA family outer membrane protein